MKDKKVTVRIDKFLANNGYSSRRGIKNFLKFQNVTINGKRVLESGTRINPEKDIIKIKGTSINKKKYIYYLLNKPKGIISTSSDEFDRENVTNLVPNAQRVYPVGRLDKDTHGLILLTNDGELTHKLTHPKYHVPKTYILTINGKVSEGKINKLIEGVHLSDGLTARAKIKIIKQTEIKTILEMEIYEGKHRQIRRMCEAIYINLSDLQRIKFGSIKIGNLKQGKYRVLNELEIKGLQKATSF